MHTTVAFLLAIMAAVPAHVLAATPCDYAFPSDSTIAWDCMRVDSTRGWIAIAPIPLWIVGKAPLPRIAGR